MINFTVGPVQSNDVVKEIGALDVPYFRTPEFSKVMLDNEQLIKDFSKATPNDRVVFITGSGTASMEAVIMNTLSKDDRALVVNGGSFGKRFTELCALHEVPFDEIKLNNGESLKPEHLQHYDGDNYTAFIVNIHETSTGVLYDINLISDYCKRNNLFLIVDAISSFLADDISFSKDKIDALIIGSQKALACPPGISIIVLSENALSRINEIECKCMYLNLKDSLKNAERGQTPFTPAVGILLQINARLHQIKEDGGSSTEINRISKLADDFRAKISELPFEIKSESLSNAVTPLHPLNASAYKIFEVLKDEYGIWVCPNGGELADTLLRVGHIGNLTENDNNALINALKDMSGRGLL